MRSDRVDDLNVIVDATVSALRIWMNDQRTATQFLAGDEKLKPLVAELLQSAANPGAELVLAQSPAQTVLRSRLEGQLKQAGYVGYLVVGPDGVVLAADQTAPIGKPVDGYRKLIYDEALAGNIVVSKPFRSPLLLHDAQGQLRADLPTMTVVAPIRDESGKTLAALGVRIRPEDQFTQILQVGRFGKTGETYAFDRKGLLLSQSRFDEQLKQVGLLVDQPEAQSILTVELRDPGADMTAGQRPATRRPEQPLTAVVAQAVTGKSGLEADGVRDYRGVLSVATWRWLEEFDFGVLTQIDVDEAFQPVYVLRRVFWVLMGLLTLCAVGIFLAMIFIERQQRSLQKATLAAMQLGQYSLGEKLGSGGMGTVYKARHAMLRRPTAIKLLKLEHLSDNTIARFEREVQLTSSLNHPNTVAIYDYGRTPDGIFYYAMEYLEGLNLDDLVKKYGPVSEARLVFLLKQVCGALAEAHSAGLVHRDLKPANIFLTSRGGQFDFVKVLDFGLVKSISGSDDAHLTNPNAITGTPLYLSPEAVNRPDQIDTRSDVYSLGALSYFLLTGTAVFQGTTIVEICMKHSNEKPESPSVRRGSPISPDLESLLLRCLEKSPENRPFDASAVLAQLEGCRVEGTWTGTDSRDWWSSHQSVTPALEADATVLVAQKDIATR